MITMKNKISLVSRRKDMSFDSPTRASLRAMKRFQEESRLESPDSHDKDVFVSLEEGSPTVEVKLPQEELDIKKVASEYLHDKDHSEVMAMVSKEKVGENWELKLQFVPKYHSRMLTSKQLAEMLRVSISTVYSLRKKGKIRGYKAGNVWRFIWKEVLAALA